MKFFKRIFWALPLLFLFYALNQEDKKETPPLRIERKVASSSDVQQKYSPQKIVHNRTVQAFRGKTSLHAQLINRIPQSVESTFEKDFAIKLSRGHVFLKNVAAVAKDNFDLSMGEVIHKDDLYVYFKTESDHHHIPVAMTKSTNKLYPISSIVHIKEVTDDIREEILSSGHSQYYYHPSLKFLSISTNGENVLKIYTELLGKGYKVELEVLKPMPGAL